VTSIKGKQSSVNGAQRKAVIAAASPAAARLLRGLELAGARPKELAATVVADFDGRTLRLAHHKGRREKLRPRHVVLSADAIEFFKEQSKDQLPGAALYRRRRGAVAATRLGPARCRQPSPGTDEVAKGISGHATAYSFRHARISELLQIYGVDPLTVARRRGPVLR
jgi:integrase